MRKAISIGIFGFAAAVWIVAGVMQQGRSATPRPLELAAAKSAVIMMADRPATSRALRGNYVNVQNCKDALLGANGDNDIASWMGQHGQVSWKWDYNPPGYTRFANDKVGIWIYASGNRNSTWPNGVYTWGYCAGDNSNIVDKMQFAPW
jgi:hypothetical protein